MLDLQNKFSGETHSAFKRARHPDNRPSDCAVFRDDVQHERPLSEASSDIPRNGLVVAHWKTGAEVESTAMAYKCIQASKVLSSQIRKHVL